MPEVLTVYNDTTDILWRYVLDNEQNDETAQFNKTIILPQQTTTGDPQIAAKIDERADVGWQIGCIVLILLCSLFGNYVMCYAVYRTPNLRTVTNLFTINLAMTDIAIATLLLPVWIVSTAAGEWPFTEEFCLTTGFFTVTLLLVSISTLAGIGLDRYFNICHALRYPMEMTSKRVYFLLAYIWTQSALLAIAPVLGWGQYQFRPVAVPMCTPNWKIDVSYSLFITAWAMVIPLGVILFSYYRIIQVARDHSKRIERVQLHLVTPASQDGDISSTEETEEPDIFLKSRAANRFQSRRRSTVTTYTMLSKNLKTLKTVFIIVGAFLICWSPYVISNIWYTASGDTMPYLVDWISTLLVFANSAINPIIFTLLNRDFRRALGLIYRKMTCTRQPDRRRRPPHLAMDSMVDTIHLHSYGSFDSGVESDNCSNNQKYSRLRHTNSLDYSYSTSTKMGNFLDPNQVQRVLRPSKAGEISPPQMSVIASRIPIVQITGPSDGDCQKVETILGPPCRSQPRPRPQLVRQLRFSDIKVDINDRIPLLQRTPSGDSYQAMATPPLIPTPVPATSCPAQPVTSPDAQNVPVDRTAEPHLLDIPIPIIPNGLAFENLNTTPNTNDNDLTTVKSATMNETPLLDIPVPNGCTG